MVNVGFQLVVSGIDGPGTTPHHKRWNNAPSDQIWTSWVDTFPQASFGSNSYSKGWITKQWDEFHSKTYEREIHMQFTVEGNTATVWHLYIARISD
jgi:hypothetical protein